jgi:1,4-alpha-glucan branching enzyme
MTEAVIPGNNHEEMMRLVSLSHHDPHTLLGMHPCPAGVVFRAFRPDAASMRLLPAAGKPVAMAAEKPAGFFACLLPKGSQFSYRLEVTTADGHRFDYRDPYAFMPTLGELDVYLAREGRHEELYRRLGAHRIDLGGARGVSFAVWAPAARGVSVVGDFNQWDGRLNPMRNMGGSGIWELFVPDLPEGALYKFEVHHADGSSALKIDPFARRTECPPKTAAVVWEPSHQWQDQAWLKERGQGAPLAKPISVYEMHLASWRTKPEEGNRPLTYLELAEQLPSYLKWLGFTHVELLPVMEHPFGGSWGYQVSSYFAPTARHGSPDDLRALVDALHQAGIGVILDWVPAHFPKDEWALARFDGTALYEHLDPRQGEHPDWGTYIFNYGRNEVRNFLLASAEYWLKECHFDGLRLDAVASMLYLDYSRKEGQWIPNKFGGRENLDAVRFMQELNAVCHAANPGVLMIAEESTAWPGVSRPTYLGGLGFGLKWNMGWMHDTLAYFSKDPIYRRWHHNNLTFGLLYAWSENFILPLSHDEVVHGKGSLLSKMPGDSWQQFANLRALYGYMWAHPGKKLLFMGGEFAQHGEWDHNKSLDWHQAGAWGHEGVKNFMADLNRVYKEEPALWRLDHEPQGFQWIDANNADDNVVAFFRQAPGCRRVACICNLSPTVRLDYRMGLPSGGYWREILNSDSAAYHGSNTGNLGGVNADSIPFHGQPFSALFTLPPLATVWFREP